LFQLKSVFDVAFSPDGRWIAAACQNVRIGLYDCRDGRLCSEAVVATPGRVAFSGDGRLLMATSKYLSWTTVWGIEADGNGARLQRVNMPSGPGNHHSNSMTAVSTATRTQRAVTGSLDRTMRLWDLDRHECLASYSGHADSVLDVDISPDGSRIVTASADGTARLWPGDLLETARRNEPSAFARNFGLLPTPKKRK
jgi:WD40 repeat protein